MKAGSGLADMASSDSAGVSASVAADTLVVPLNDLARLKAVFELHGHDIAAVIVEPVPANNGLLVQTDDFLPKMAELARAAGSLVIFDEVITGFRVAFGGMAEKTGIRPDLVTYGKIIGGGFPVGAYGGRADLMDWIAPMGPVYQAGTLSANPVAMTAGITTLLKLKRDDPYQDLEKKTLALAASLEKVARELDYPATVQTYGSLFWMLLGGVNTPDGKVRVPSQAPETHKARYSRLFHSLLGKGIYLAPSAFEVSFLSVAHQEEHLARYVSAFKEAIQELGQVGLALEKGAE